MFINKPVKAVAAIVGSLLLATPIAAQSSVWMKQVHSQIRENFSYPRSAVVRGEQGQAIIRLTLAADGIVTSVTLTKSSGSEILDREAVRIAQKVKKIPSPPRGVASVQVPISFQLN
jgi:periplasmic protein TonB